MQRKTAFQVASSNSQFLLSLADAMDKLPTEDRMFLRRQIFEHNEKNLEVMNEAVKAKMRRVA